MTEYIVQIEDSEKNMSERFVGQLRSYQELIRCMDCKYFCAEQVEEHTPYGFTNMYWTYWCDKHTDYENQEYLEVNIDDFCSWAERKEK